MEKKSLIQLIDSATGEVTRLVSLGTVETGTDVLTSIQSADHGQLGFFHHMECTSFHQVDDKISTCTLIQYNDAEGAIVAGPTTAISCIVYHDTNAEHEEGGVYL